MEKKRLLILLLILYLPISVFAETIVLKSGKSVEGKLIEKTDKYIKIDFQGIAPTYYLDEIESIDGKLVSTPKKSVIIEISNPGYAKPPNKREDIAINSESTVREILTKTNYYYSTHNFDKAIEINPNNPIYYNGLGTVYGTMGNNDKALIYNEMFLCQEKISFCPSCLIPGIMIDR